MRLKNFVYILALFMVLLCCFSAVSASENVDDSVSVSDDVAMDEVVSEVDSDDESISVQENEEIESSDDVDNESLEVSDVEEVDDVDDSSSVLSAEENDEEVSGQTHNDLISYDPNDYDLDIYDAEIIYGDDTGDGVVSFDSYDSSLVGDFKVSVDNVVKYTHQIKSSDYEYDYGDYSLIDRIYVHTKDLGITKEGSYNIKVTLNNQILEQSFITVSIVPNVEYPSEISVGEKEFITVSTVSGRNGNAKLYKYDGGAGDFIDEFPIVNGYGSYSLSNLPEGSHELYLVYTVGGLSKTRYIDVEVRKNSPGFSSSVAPAEITVGSTVTVNVNGPSSNSNVYISVDGKEVKSVVFTRGQISELLSGLTVGTHRINVYLNDNYNDYFYSNTMQVTVKNKQTPTTPAKKATKITAKKATFKAKKKVKKYTITLKAGKAAVKKVKVTLKIGKKTYKATTNAKGKATFKIKKLTKKGKYNAVVKFAGKGNYLKTSKKVKITIK